MPEVGPGPQKRIHAKMRLATFIGDISSEAGIKTFNKKVTEFLDTVDNVSRVINGRNTYAVGENKLCIQLWYLETIKPEPIIKPLGKKDDKKS